MNSIIYKTGLLGGYEILIIVLVIVLLLGGKKIPELMKGLGKGVRNFKDATEKDDLKNDVKEITSELKDVENEIRKNTEPAVKTKRFIDKNISSKKY